MFFVSIMDDLWLIYFYCIADGICGQSADIESYSRDHLQCLLSSNNYNVDALASILLEDTTIPEMTAQPATVEYQLPEVPSPTLSYQKELTWFNNTSDNALQTMPANHAQINRPDGGVDHAPPIPRKSSRRRLSTAKQSDIDDLQFNERNDLNYQTDIDHTAERIDISANYFHPEMAVRSSRSWANSEVDVNSLTSQPLESHFNPRAAEGVSDHGSEYFEVPRPLRMNPPNVGHRQVSSRTLRKNEGKLPDTCLCNSEACC